VRLYRTSIRKRRQKFHSLARIASGTSHEGRLYKLLCCRLDRLHGRDGKPGAHAINASRFRPDQAQEHPVAVSPRRSDNLPSQSANRPAALRSIAAIKNGASSPCYGRNGTSGDPARGPAAVPRTQELQSQSHRKAGQNRQDGEDDGNIHSPRGTQGRGRPPTRQIEL